MFIRLEYYTVSYKFELRAAHSGILKIDSKLWFQTLWNKGNKHAIQLEESKNWYFISWTTKYIKPKKYHFCCLLTPDDCKNSGFRLQTKKRKYLSSLVQRAARMELKITYIIRRGDTHIYWKKSSCVLFLCFLCKQEWNVEIVKGRVDISNRI